MKKRWIVLLTLLWPVGHLVLFLVRFGRLPPMWEIAYFVPTGALAVLAIHLLLLRSRSAGQTMSTVLGALVLSPFAVVGNLLGVPFGLAGITAYGLAPLTAGAVLGWLFGKRFRPAPGR